MFGHVSSLSVDLFGDTSSFKDWHFVGEYGGENGRDIRRWDKDYDVRATAGEVLGTVGGNPGQWALDFAVYDQRHPAENVANPGRYGGGAPIVTCPLSYFEGVRYSTSLWLSLTGTRWKERPYPVVSSYRTYPEQLKAIGTSSELATILTRFLRTRISPSCTIISTLR